MESFFNLLQKNVLGRQSWASQQELRLAIVSWNEGTCHRKRRQRRLGNLTPIECVSHNDGSRHQGGIDPRLRPTGINPTRLNCEAASIGDAPTIKTIARSRIRTPPELRAYNGISSRT